MVKLPVLQTQGQKLQDRPYGSISSIFSIKHNVNHVKWILGLAPSLAVFGVYGVEGLPEAAYRITTDELK